jgi:hypothetical protein
VLRHGRADHDVARAKRLFDRTRCAVTIVGSLAAFDRRDFPGDPDHANRRLRERGRREENKRGEGDGTWPHVSLHGVDSIGS